MLTLNSDLLNFIAGPLIALLVGLLTRTKTPAWIQASLNLLLSAVGGSLALLASPVTHLSLGKFAVAVFVTWVTSIATHYGFWKPTGASDALQAIPFGFANAPAEPQHFAPESGVSEPAPAEGA